MLKKKFQQKVSEIINAELTLLDLKIRYPEPFNYSTSTTFESDLYVVPKSKNLGIIGIAEIVLGLFLQGEITGKDGKPVSKACLARGFEQFLISNLAVSTIKLVKYLPVNRTILLKHWMLCEMLLPKKTVNVRINKD